MRRLVSSLGEPVVRQAVLQAMRIMGGQYVLGRTIEEGLKKGLADNRPGKTCLEKSMIFLNSKMMKRVTISPIT